MAISVDVKFDKAALKRVENMLRGFPKAVPKVMSRGINKTGAAAKTEIARRIAAEVKIKLSTIKAGIDLDRASYSRWQAELGIFGRRIPLINFAARQTKSGVSYSIEKSAGRKKIESAFIQTMASGHTGVFKRVGESRHPIRELMGPSVGAAFENAGSIAKDVRQSTTKKLKHNIDVQVKMILDRKRAA